MRKTQPEILMELIESIGQAEGATSQLVHTSGNPVAFMTMRETLATVKEMVMQLAPQGLSKVHP